MVLMNHFIKQVVETGKIKGCVEHFINILNKLNTVIWQHECKILFITKMASVLQFRIMIFDIKNLRLYQN